MGSTAAALCPALTCGFAGLRQRICTLAADLSRHGLLRAQIEGVRIAGPWRGQGLGGAMIGWAIEEARRGGCGLVQLTSDKRRAHAIRFYEALGFAPTHEGLKLSLNHALT